MIFQEGWETDYHYGEGCVLDSELYYWRGWGVEVIQESMSD